MLQLLSVSVSLKDVVVLSNISLTINRSEMAYIVGPTGAGKTTLLRTIFLDVIPIEGEVVFDKYSSLTIKKRQIPYLRRQMGIVFQDFKLLQDRTVFDNILFVLRTTGSSSQEAKRKAVKVLTNVGMLSKRDRFPHELSGGEIQRVCIARAIVNNPLIILADEPTGNLDPESAHAIFLLLKQLNERGVAVLTATHNYQIVKDFPGRVYHLDGGRMIV